MTYPAIGLIVLTVLFLSIAQPVWTQTVATSSPSVEVKFEETIPIWLEELIVPGAAVALIENGALCFAKGYGLADRDEQIPVTETTGFNIASISKTISAWGVMKLVEEGKLMLDEPASTYLTRWELPASEFDASGVTIRRLLSHTAGLSLHGYPGWTPQDTLPSIEESLNGKTNGAGDVRLIMEPGTRWQYSGGGYTMLQLIIEEVTGQSFAEYMQEAVLNPLGMTNSSFRIDDRIMAATSKEHNGYGKEIPFELFTAQAAAGLHTTIQDMAKFALASLNANNAFSVLQASTINQMMQPAPASDGRYGLGYSMEHLPDGKPMLVGHGGSNSGWQTMLRLDPENGNGLIILTNGATGYAVMNQIFHAWLLHTYDVDWGWLRRKPITPLMIRNMEANGIDGAIAAYREAKASNLDGYRFSEDDVNLFAYELMWDGRMDDAMKVFQLNIEEHPYAFNTYDSYGEALLAQGDTTQAIVNYRKSIKLEPKNDNGRRVLATLGVIVPPYVEPVSILKAPEDWGSEIIPFPINFAPTIDLQGYEELAFAPGWRDSTSQNFWSIVYVWYVDSLGDTDANWLEGNLEAYFDGLANLVRYAKQGAVPTECTLSSNPNGWQGSMRVFDPFTLNRMMNLNINVEQSHCAVTGKELLRFHVSSAPFGEAVWDRMGEVGVTVACD